MELFGIGILALCAVLFAALVQKSNKEYALLISLGAAVVLLLLILDQAEPLFRQIQDMASQGASRRGSHKIDAAGNRNNRGGPSGVAAV